MYCICHINQVRFFFGITEANLSAGCTILLHLKDCSMSRLGRMVMATDSGYRRRIGTLVQIKAEETSGQGLPKKYLKTKEVITFL